MRLIITCDVNSCVHNNEQIKAVLKCEDNYETCKNKHILHCINSLEHCTCICETLCPLTGSWAQSRRHKVAKEYTYQI